MSAEDEVRQALAHIVAGPPDNGVSYQQALAALDRLVADRDSWKRVARQYEAALAERGLL